MQLHLAGFVASTLEVLLHEGSCRTTSYLQSIHVMEPEHSQPHSFAGLLTSPMLMVSDSCTNMSGNWPMIGMLYGAVHTS